MNRLMNVLFMNALLISLAFSAHSLHVSGFDNVSGIYGKGSALTI